MRSIERWTAAGLIAALTVLAARADNRATISKNGRAALSRSLSSAVGRGDVPGVVAIVVDPDNVLFEGAAGQQDVARRIEMKPDAIFRIASMTKPLTTVAAMMLIEAGKLNLDDPVSKYLPRFKDRPVISSFDPSTGAYETTPAASEVAIRHLLTHT